MKRSAAQPRGFTLIEMVMSMLVISIIMLALQSAMLLASRATPNHNGTNYETFTGATALDRLATDLTAATAFTTMGGNSVTFTVPDRNNDGSPETITYSWSGTAGGSLQRSVNGHTAVTVASNVNEFSLIYDKKSTKQPTSYTEGPETLLFNSDGSSQVADASISGNNGTAQYFQPTLPSGTVYWRITRVRYKARVNLLGSGEVAVQVRGANNSVPTSSVIDFSKLTLSGLSILYGWQEADFSNATNLSPTAGAAIAFINISGTCFVQYRTDSAAANAARDATTNGGSSWGYSTSQAVVMYIYGTTATQNADSYTYNLTGIRCTLRCGSDAKSQLQTSVHVLSEPQVTGP